MNIVTLVSLEPLKYFMRIVDPSEFRSVEPFHEDCNPSKFRTVEPFHEDCRP